MGFQLHFINSTTYKSSSNIKYLSYGLAALQIIKIFHYISLDPSFIYNKICDMIFCKNRKPRALHYFISAKIKLSMHKAKIPPQCFILFFIAHNYNKML